MTFSASRTSALALGILLLSTLSFGTRAATEGQPCIDEPTDELIGYSDLRTCVITPIGDLDIFRFVGSAGEIVRVRASEGGGSTTPDVCISLRRPDGSTLVATTCDELSAAIEATLDATGEHAIFVSELGGDQTMSYTLVLERIVPTGVTNTRLESGISLASEMISPFGDIDLYTFEGAAGDLIRIDASEGGGSTTPDVCIDLRRPDGSRIGSVVCGEVSAAIETTLDQDGEHTVIMSELGSNQGMNFTLLYTCLFGNCPSLTRPLCDIELDKGSYTAGETVTATTFRLANPGTGNVPVEWKVWLRVPGFPPVSILNIGASGGFVLTPGFDTDFGPVPLLNVTAGFPPGGYEFGCRLMRPVTGATISLDRNPFEVTQ